MTLNKTLSAALLCGGFALATTAMAADVAGVSSAAPTNTTSAVNDRTTIHAPEVDQRINAAGNVAPNPNIPQTQNDVNPNLSSQANADRSNLSQSAQASGSGNANLSSSESANAVRTQASFSPAPISQSQNKASHRGRPNAREYAQEQKVTADLNAASANGTLNLQ